MITGGGLVTTYAAGLKSKGPKKIHVHNHDIVAEWMASRARLDLYCMTQNALEGMGFQRDDANTATAKAHEYSAGMYIAGHWAGELLKTRG